MSNFYNQDFNVGPAGVAHFIKVVDDKLQITPMASMTYYKNDDLGKEVSYDGIEGYKFWEQMIEYFKEYGYNIPKYGAKEFRYPIRPVNTKFTNDLSPATALKVMDSIDAFIADGPQKTLEKTPYTWYDPSGGSHDVDVDSGISHWQCISQFIRKHGGSIK